MAPEQLEGQEADHRSDIFAFGAVLYEMVTGRKAFEGKSQASLISSILTSEPAPVASLQPLATPALDHLVRTCLAKDPEDRWQSAADVSRQLERIVDTGSDETPSTIKERGGSWRRSAALFLSGSVAAGLIALAFLYLQSSAPPERVQRLSLPFPPSQELGLGRRVFAAARGLPHAELRG